MKSTVPTTRKRMSDNDDDNNDNNNDKNDDNNDNNINDNDEHDNEDRCTNHPLYGGEAQRGCCLPGRGGVHD